MNIKLHKLNYERIAKHFAIAFNSLFILILILSIFNYLQFNQNTIILFCFVIFVNTLWIALKINKISENKREKNPLVYIFSYLFLLTLIIFIINQLLNNEIITALIPYLTILSISFGFLTFYSHKNKIEKETENKKAKRDEEEKKRKEEFEKKFPRISKIWGLKKIIQWMYKEGWAFSIPIVVITLIFIVIKIGMPLIYHGSYIDEYLQIFSGINLFKTGHFAEFGPGIYYNRGAYVSLIVGLFFKLFGQTILVAKLVPAIIGIINFFLLYLIARKIIGKKYIPLLLILYTISPWVIFNQFYIRMYVFYEFFILAISLLLIKLFSNYEKEKSKWKYVLLLILINLVSFLFSNDAGRYMILLFTIIFLFCFYIITKPKKSSNKYKSNKVKIIILIFIGGFLFLILSGLLNFLLYASVPNTNPLHLDYSTLFFKMSTCATIIFILGCIFTFLFSKKSNNNISKSLFFSIFALFIIHLISSPDLQIIRGIAYFLPLFYLGVVNGLSKLKTKKVIFIGIIILIIGLEIIVSYPPKFLNAPYIPNEVNYIDNNIYLDAYKYCIGAKIITSGRPEIATFFNVTPNFYLYSNRIDSNIYLFNSSNNITEYYYTKTPAIENVLSLSKIINSSSKVCFIYGGGLPNSWVDNDELEMIAKESNIRFKNYQSTSDSFKSELYIKD